MILLDNFFDNAPINESVFDWDNQGSTVVSFDWTIFVEELFPQESYFQGILYRVQLNYP